jgi:hypothetical protein
MICHFDGLHLFSVSWPKMRLEPPQTPSGCVMIVCEQFCCRPQNHCEPGFISHTDRCNSAQTGRYSDRSRWKTSLTRAAALAVSWGCGRPSHTMILSPIRIQTNILFRLSEQILGRSPGSRDQPKIPETVPAEFELFDVHFRSSWQKSDLDLLAFWFGITQQM